MEKIYEQAKDLHVRKVVIYGNASKAYADAEHTVQLKTSELKDAFLMGCVVDAGSGLVVPTAYAEASNVGSITCGEATYAAVADPV